MRGIILSATMMLSSILGMAQTPDGTYRFTNGGYEVFTIASSDKSFQPASLYYGENNADKAKVDTMAPDGKVPTAMNCFVVNTPDGYIMIDTGLPESKGGKTLERLKSLNVAPTDIKAIYLTHSHFDHIGGLLDESDAAVYPNCTLYIPAKENAFMHESMAETISKIENAYSNRIVTFDWGEILPNNVLPIAAPGHTPGHTAYRLGSILFVGDLLHGAEIQLKDPTICANFDADRDQSIETRKLLLSYIITNSLTALGNHVPYMGLISF